MASKRASQRKWHRKNPGYFRGEVHVRRVRAWRRKHPGYWKAKGAATCGPAEVESRAVVGHREGDLINGAAKTGHLVTAVDPPAPRDALRQAGRNTRFTPAGRTDSKEAEEVTAALGALFLQVPAVARTGLTLDNGKEFTRHEEPARTTGLEVFFARPCHSWERGTNENTNGLIRRLHPKRSSFAHIGQAGPRRIDRYLNDRPRRCPGRRTPREVMAAFLASAP